MRKEHDLLGEKLIPDDASAQTVKGGSIQTSRRANPLLLLTLLPDPAFVFRDAP